MDDLMRKAIYHKVQQVIQEQNLSLENPDLSFDGNSLIVSGTTRDQAMKNKILALANQAGVNVVDRITVRQQASAASSAGSVEIPAQEEKKIYVVQSGDSLSKIAKAHYGDAMQYPKIFEANRHILDDPNKIFPGQELIIP